MKICMLVRNTVTKDARVLKEANTLINHGYEVIVIGIQDAIITNSFEQKPNGLKIYRAAWKTKRASYIRLFLIGAFIFSLMAVLYFELFHQLSSISATLVQTLLNGVSFVVPVIALLLVPFLVFRFFTIRILKAQRILDYETVREGLGVSSDISGYGFRYYIIRSMKYILELLVTMTKLICSPIRFMRRVLRRGAQFIGARRLYNGFKRSFVYSTNHLLSLYAYRQSVLEIVKKHDVDIIHAHDISTLPVGVALKQKLGVPLVYDAHEIYEEAVGVPFFGRLLYRNINRLLLTSGNIDLFITINESFIDYYQNTYPRSPKGILVMNAAVKSNFVEYDGRLHDAAGIDRSKKIILFQGGVTKKRGVVNLLQAANYLDSGWVLVFMGWGFYEKQILEYANEEGSNVRLIGPAPQDELPLWTSGATVGVIPYEEYGLNHKYCTPNKLWEYPNALVPILASPRDELTRIVTKNQTGKIMSEPVTPAVFAKEMMFSDSEVTVFKKHCREFIELNSWAAYEKNILDGYNRLALSKATA
ncbi:MAG: glycosyltransferase involved in cell wall biosynthesis [Patiriisocius sp.]|jgi:glycosyltransferase involved in cell wall biosynthesis